MSKTTYEELEQERDESVAHCEVLNSALIQALAFMARETCDIEDEQQQKRIQDAVHNYKKILEQTPTQSLLRHDAMVIENLMDSMTELSQSPYLPDTLLTGATFTVVNEWGKEKAEEFREQTKRASDRIE